ncbi:large ribosomal subunit protein mL46-like [Tubulanus polymorphus]|uniref:large ribosomal subunit protein mL46-like n=1 Tax=Tubulanus polymorphus TaxID=672921 RepID=UPI003DA43F59
MAASMSSRILKNFNSKIYKTWLKHGIRKASAVTDEAPVQKWKLCSAVCVERYPVITAPMNTLETKCAELMSQLELENSVLSNHEIQHKEDLKIAEKKKLGDEDFGEVIIQTRLDLEDIWEHELQKFSPAPRTTESDKTNDLKSTDRKLDRKLVLLVKQKLGANYHWIFPQKDLTDDEDSMREVADNALIQNCGEQMKTQIFGNAPCGFHKYKYGAGKLVDDTIGSKVFFFKAQLRDGNVTINDGTIADYVWIPKEELEDYLLPSYLKSVNKFLLDL